MYYNSAILSRLLIKYEASGNEKGLGADQGDVTSGLAARAPERGCTPGSQIFPPFRNMKSGRSTRGALRAPQGALTRCPGARRRISLPTHLLADRPPWPGRGAKQAGKAPVRTGQGTEFSTRQDLGYRPQPSVRWVRRRRSPTNPPLRTRPRVVRAHRRCLFRARGR